MSETNGHTLGDVASFIRGITFTPDDVTLPFEKGTAVCMRTKNVQADLDEDDLIAVPKSFVRRTEQYLTEGDMLVSSANSWNLVGKCSWVPKLDYEATAGGFISILRADRKQVDPRYLYHWFAAPRTQHEVRLCGRQTTNISNLNYERCLNLPIPLPKLEEQKRIAAILDKADAIRRKRQERLAVYVDLLEAAYLERFGFPLATEGRWPMVPLKALAKFKRGKFTPRPRNDPRYYGGEYPFIQTGELTNCDGYLRTWRQTLNKEGTKVSKCFPPGTVCIALVGATIGETAILDFESYFPDSLIGIQPKPKESTPEFIEYTLRFYKPWFRNRAPETARANINVQTLESLTVPQAPIDLQCRFSETYKQLDKLRTQESEAIKLSDDLFNSLVQRAFKGEL
ncbi:MAG: restriction endonuclease subunit S [Planctomycetaceae bacterium]|nr:restriction endonuclease subunit S [Planctomycetales bacterium]MCB9925386.1 restriction endonuclease subunit S [Planctomycetaceae bacterium]